MYSDILLYLAFLNLPGWLAGLVVEKSDFYENPVVSLDMEFNLGFVKKNLEILNKTKLGLELQLSCDSTASKQA